MPCPAWRFRYPPTRTPAKVDVADFLSQYTATFDLPVSLDTRATGLRHVDGEFELFTRDEVFRAGQVVVATGPFQVPYIPSVVGTFDDSVAQVHSSGYRNPSALPDGPVLVVGSGNSGLQIAEELVTTREVIVSVGEQLPMLPQRLLGRDLFCWLTRLGLMRVSTASRLGRRMRDRGEFVIGTNRRQLGQAGVRFRPRLVDAGGRTARFADGSSLEVGVVVWATGYRFDYSWISVPDAVYDGRVAHHRGVSQVPGLYFLDLPWQHTRGSALLGFVAADAAYLSDRIADSILRK